MWRQAIDQQSIRRALSILREHVDAILVIEREPEQIRLVVGFPHPAHPLLRAVDASNGVAKHDRVVTRAEHKLVLTVYDQPCIEVVPHGVGLPDVVPKHAALAIDFHDVIARARSPSTADRGCAAPTRRARSYYRTEMACLRYWSRPRSSGSDRDRTYQDRVRQLITNVGAAASVCARRCAEISCHALQHENLRRAMRAARERLRARAARPRVPKGRSCDRLPAGLGCPPQ